MLTSLRSALEAHAASAKADKDEFAYWDAANTARELYRAQTNTTFTGAPASLTLLLAHAPF